MCFTLRGMKRQVNLRVDDELWRWVESYAAQRKWTRTTVVETALADLRGLARGGVPDPPREPADRPAVSSARVLAWERQRRLNEAKDG